ncbi:MAG: alpha/beta hydrolase [Pseudomonadota bacterium]
MRAQTDLLSGSLPFHTVRNQVDTDEPDDLFGEARSDLKAGYCYVTEREVPGLSAIADAIPAYLVEELLNVDKVVLAAPEAVLDDLVETADETAPVLYTHGYHIGFEKGCRRALMLQEAANLTERFLWFSWPSDGSLASYTFDEADLYWSVPDLADAIISLEDRFGGGVVDVVGHSLGGRGTVLALFDIATRRPDIRLDEVVLIAPDMDFEIFLRIYPRIAGVAESFTVYMSDKDRPLQLSAQLHGYSRLGEAGNAVEALPGIEFINVSNLPPPTPTGHLYHIYDDTVGEDLNALLNGGLRAAARLNLEQTGPNTWSFVSQQ